MRSSLKLFAFLAAGLRRLVRSKSSVSTPDSGAPPPGDIGDAGKVTPANEFTTSKRRRSRPEPWSANGLHGSAAGARLRHQQAAVRLPERSRCHSQEADIYRIDNDGSSTSTPTRPAHLRSDRSQNPKQLSRLPVYGYPIEMFVRATPCTPSQRRPLSHPGQRKLQFDRHYVRNWWPSTSPI